MPIRFIMDYPALFISNKKILVIADLHLGLEHELYNAGIVIPSQAEKFKKQIDKLLKLTKTKRLIILGDLKHKVPGISFRELKEVPKLIDHLMKKTEVVLVKGNHDVELKDIIADVKVYPAQGFKLGRYGFFHGHAWPSKQLMQCDYLFMGHVHPAVEFKDKLGFRAIEQIWVRGNLDKKHVKKRFKIEKTGKLRMTILPSFNKILGGIALNRVAKEEYIGPLLANKILDVDKAKAYLLDGSLLGNIANLKS